MKSRTVMDMIRSVCKLVMVLITSVAVANILIIVVYGIPTDRMFSHAKSGAELFGSNYIDTWAPGIPSATPSYPTDAIMINNAIYRDNKSIVFNAMMNPRYEDGAGNVVSSLSQVLTHDSLNEINPKLSAIAPEDSARDDKNTTHELETMYYPRYWHGYLLFLKPMLLVLDVSEIKILMMTLQITLAALAVFLIDKKIDRGVAVGFLTTLIILNPITVALTFQNNTIYVLSLVSMVLILLFNDRLKEKNRYSVYFMIWGSTTCFFDFLTYPLVTLGFSLCLFILLNGKDLGAYVVDMVKYSIAWSIGYVGLWVGKFISCKLMTGYDLLAASAKSVLFRMGLDNLGNESYQTTVLEAIKINVLSISNWISLLMIIIIISVCILLYSHGYRKDSKREKIYCLLVLSAYPLIWYAGTKNHSYIHYYMTYRELSITWFCIMSIILCDWKRRCRILE